MLVTDQTDYPRAYGVGKTAVYIVMRPGQYPLWVDYWDGADVPQARHYALTHSKESTIVRDGYNPVPLSNELLASANTFWSSRPRYAADRPY